MIKTGSTRWVLLIGNVAIKFPALWGWSNFLKGLLANMQERLMWNCSEMKDKLCPIVFSIPYGFLIVMRRAKVATVLDITEEQLYDYCQHEKWVLPVELKHDSFGYYKGKLVAIDYGN